MPGTVPSVWQHQPVAIGREEVVKAEHRRRLAQDAEITLAMVLAMRPSSSSCSSDVTVSSSSYVSVPGIAQTYRATLAGSLSVAGVLHVHEDAAGQLGVRILSGSTVLWEAPAIQEQASELLVGTDAQLAKWLVPVGGPGLLTVTGETTYALDVQVAAVDGEFTVKSGAESWLEATLNPTVGIS